MGCVQCLLFSLFLGVLGHAYGAGGLAGVHSNLTTSTTLFPTDSAVATFDSTPSIANIPSSSTAPTSYATSKSTAIITGSIIRKSSANLSAMTSVTFLNSTSSWPGLNSTQHASSSTPNTIIGCDGKNCPGSGHFSSYKLNATGTGTLYASLCNLNWQDYYTSSSLATTVDVSSEVTIRTTYHNLSATITTLCDGQPRVLGGLTTVATGTTSWVTTTFYQSGPNNIATPSCSIQPYDCGWLSQSWDNKDYVFEASTSRVASSYMFSVMLGEGASAITIGNGFSTNTTTFAATITAPPVLTLPPGITVTASTDESDIGPYYVVEVASTNEQILYPGSFIAYYDNPGPSVILSQEVILCNTSTNSAVSTAITSPFRTYDCGSCTVKVDEVQLIYFQSSLKTTKDLCGPTTRAFTTCPLGPTTAPYTPGWCSAISGPCSCPYAPVTSSNSAGSGPYLVSNGSRFYQNRAYISIANAYAVDLCGSYVGKSYGGSILTFASSQIYSIGGVPGADFDNGPNTVDGGYPFNFNDLTTVPWAVYSPEVQEIFVFESMANTLWDPSLDFINGMSPNGGGVEATIVDAAYRPQLLIPREIRSLDPAWSTCRIDIEGVWDPPIALTMPSSFNPDPLETTSTFMSETTPASPAAGPTTNVPATATAARATSTDLPDPASQALASVHQSQTMQGNPNAMSVLASALTTSASGNGASASNVQPSNSNDSADDGSSASNGDPVANTPIVVIGGSTFTASSSSNIIVVGSHTLTVGSPAQTLANGHTISAGSSGLIVDASQTLNFGKPNTIPAVAIGGATFTPGGAALTINDVTYSALPSGSGVIIASNGVTQTVATGPSRGLIVDGSSLSVGQAATINGITYSRGSLGLLIDGSPMFAVPTAPAVAQAVFTGADGRFITASTLPGHSGVYIVDGVMVTQGGAAETIDGVVVSAASGGLVVGSHTVRAGNAWSTNPAWAVFTSSDGRVQTNSAVSGQNGAKSSAASSRDTGSNPVMLVGVVALCLSLFYSYF